MIIEELKHITPVNGVLKISEVDDSYEKMLLKIKTIEKRIYTDEEAKLLPFASKLNPHKEEWNLRVKSFLRFKNYLSQKKSGLNILNLGCGTGWFAAQILREQDHNFFCVDINLQELQQGARIFSSENLKFIYADIFLVKFPRSSFDMVIMDSSIQYFSDLSNLMRELFYLLHPYGEIHIIDSPFYKDEELEIVKDKTNKYYELLGFPEMKERYFHHSLKSIKNLNYSFLYNPNTITNKLLGVAFSKDSSNPWIVINR